MECGDCGNVIYDEFGYCRLCGDATPDELGK